jgi:sugar lactone lactonase YvrE/enterochelin esterase-like enzyme
MRTRGYSITLVLLACGMTFAQQASTGSKLPSPDDQYVPGPDSQPQPGVPKGKIFEFTFDHSKVFPGTTRKISVYVPAEYRAGKPACVYVGLDALAFEAPTVFDNLIYKHEMPVTIAIGVAPGVVDSASQYIAKVVPKSAGPSNEKASGLWSPQTQDARFNRSFEFDGLNSNLARFLLDEVLPEVERHKTLDGLPILLSRDPNDHAVGGGSTGGIAAFTLAWERPDAFRRVFTAIGTFVGMRGGDRYPVLVRKTEPKPIRIFMQDGSNDEWMGGPEIGDWWMSNQTMQRALEFAGYQVKHVWGEGTHNGNHPTAIFPDAMRWLWKDWPQPVQAGQSQNTFINAILRPEDGWQVVQGDYQSAAVLAADQYGQIVFQDITGGKSWKIASDGHLSPYDVIKKPYVGMAFGPDGRVYVADAVTAKIVAYTRDGKSSTIAKNIRGLNLIVTNGGTIYVTEPGSGDERSGKVWLIKSTGERSLLDTGLNHPSGIALSPDGLWLAVAENKTHWGYSYRVRADGTVEDKQQFYWFHVPDEADDSGAGAWSMDREGRLYAATRMGVQVFDRDGRVRAILPVPGGEVTSISFGGPDFDTLYVTCVDRKVYKRILKVPGVPDWAAPIELPS